MLFIVRCAIVRCTDVGLFIVGLAVIGLAVVGYAAVGLAVVGLAVVGLAVVGLGNHEHARLWFYCQNCFVFFYSHYLTLFSIHNLILLLQHILSYGIKYLFVT